MLEIGEKYSRVEIHKMCGGSMQSYLPFVHGAVVAACLTLKLNLGAPNFILCGNGPVIKLTGKMLANQCEAIPVFIKDEGIKDVKRWEYKGNFKVIASYSSGTWFKDMVTNSDRASEDVSLVIELESV
jgi:hypothetical protein